MRQTAQNVGSCQRPYSIRTRIKTLHRGHGTPRTWRVRDHIPLEQGLRLTREAWDA